MSSVAVFLLIVILFAGAVVVFYNRLVRLRQYVREAWSAIDTELRRRYDLVPNLVSVVRGYASHEKDTLESVTAARNAAASAHGTPSEQAATENALTGALRQLFAVSEAYPDLKASENFARLHADLTETEDRIAKARRYYNANVREWNTAVESFPGVLIARSLGFDPADYFEIEDYSAREPVAVDLQA